jgi:hypothetical protein
MPSGSGGTASGGSVDEPANTSAGGRALGLREALLVGELVVVVVLLAGVATFLLPGGRDLVLGTPLLIVILIAGTAGVLWRISRPARPDR